MIKIISIKKTIQLFYLPYDSVQNKEINIIESTITQNYIGAIIHRKKRITKKLENIYVKNSYL